MGKDPDHKGNQMDSWKGQPSERSKSESIVKQTEMGFGLYARE